MIRWFEKNKIFSIIFFVSIAIEIFFFSSISGVPNPKSTLDLSIVYHFSVFFLLSFFLLVILDRDKDVKLKYVIISFIFSIIYSILDEAHQIFVPFRSPDFLDILTDNVGILCSVLLHLYRKR